MFGNGPIIGVLGGVIVEMLGTSSEGVGIPTTGVCDSGVPIGADDRSGARLGAFGVSNAVLGISNKSALGDGTTVS